jgi:hypothetical protein
MIDMEYCPLCNSKLLVEVYVKSCPSSSCIFCIDKNSFALDNVRGTPFLRYFDIHITNGLGRLVVSIGNRFKIFEPITFSLDREGVLAAKEYAERYIKLQAFT